jgi:hypothetical protein
VTPSKKGTMAAPEPKAQEQQKHNTASLPSSSSTLQVFGEYLQAPLVGLKAKPLRRHEAKLHGWQSRPAEAPLRREPRRMQTLPAPRWSFEAC